MPFGITGLGGFAQQAPADFPRFLQWQLEGTDLGDNAVETVNLVGGVTATRGSGEASSTLTIEVTEAPVVDVSANEVYAGPTSGAAAPAAFRAVVPLDLPALSWRDLPGDGAFDPATDIDNGIAASATTGAQTLTIGPGDLPTGRSCLLLQQGSAQLTVAAQSGLDLLYRSDVFDPMTAGEGAILTLIARSSTQVVICGDLAQAS